MRKAGTVRSHTRAFCDQTSTSGNLRPPPAKPRAHSLNVHAGPPAHTSGRRGAATQLPAGAPSMRPFTTWPRRVIYKTVLSCFQNLHLAPNEPQISSVAPSESADSQSVTAAAPPLPLAMCLSCQQTPLELLTERRWWLMMANKLVPDGTTAGPVMCGIDGNGMMDSQPAASASNQEKVTRGCFSSRSLKKEPRQLRHGKVKLLHIATAVLSLTAHQIKLPRPYCLYAVTDIFFSQLFP